jgi:sugar phosphate isomerase/epimerase
MLELSCADYTFPLLRRREALALIRILEIDYVDIGLFARSSSFPASDLMASPHEFIDAVHNDLEAAALRPADVFLQIGKDPIQVSANDPDKRVRQAARNAFCRALEFCSAIQCSHMTGLPGVMHGDQSRDFALAAEEADWRVSTAAQADVVYSIEPHLDSICYSTKATHEFLSQVPGLTLTLDYGHFIFQGESNSAIHGLLPYASHLHLRGAALGRLQTAVSESIVDTQHILKSLFGSYSGKLALEYVWSDWHDCDRTDNLSETILLRRQVVELQAKLNAGVPQHV